MNISELRKICQSDKLKRNEGLTLYHRRISIYYTRIFISLGISANVVSVCGILCGILGSICFIPGDWRFNLTGVFLLYLSFSSDQVDGELARYYKTVNLNGVYLDEIRHLIIYGITIFCLSFPVARDFGTPSLFLLGFLGAMSLTISRIEERLPSQIFTEKVVLNDNFTGGSFSEEGSGPEKLSMGGASENSKLRGSLVHSVSLMVYKTYSLLSHQVLILFWLLAVTLIDHLVLNGSKWEGVLSVQSFFFLIFSVFGPILLLRTMQGHFKENKVEHFCRQVLQESKSVSHSK